MLVKNPRQMKPRDDDERVFGPGVVGSARRLADGRTWYLINSEEQSRNWGGKEMLVEAKESQSD